MNKLQRFVLDFGGAHKLAAKLGCTPEAVYVWCKGKGNPKATTITKLINLSKGKLTFEIIVKCCAKTPKKD